MFINNCRQTKRSKPTDKPVTVLRPIRLVKAKSFAEQLPVIAAAMDAKLAELAAVAHIKKAFAATKLERQLAAQAMLEEFRRDSPPMIGSKRRK